MIAPLGLELCLFGRAELRLNGAPLNITVRKLLGLVVYLAIEGPSSRSTLSALLWSELNEADARRNLRQRLYRLSPADLSACLLIEAELVSLAGPISSDAAAFERAVLESDFARAVGLYRGPLLAGLQLEEASDFDDWLDLKRDGFERAHQRALAGWAGQLEAAGSNTQALAQHLRLIEINPLLELHQRQVMRLRGLTGDRAEAIAGFERFRALLESELGLEPMPETVQLAESIRRQGTLEPRNVRASAIHVLPSSSTPMIGREAVLQQFEDAWKADRIVLISGEPGVGKTRLLSEFSAGKNVAFAQARVGDARIPFASQTRFIRALLEANPNLDLPRWVRQELSRLIPSLDDAPPPGGPEARIRLFDAVAEFYWLTRREADTLLVDDLQFFDADSFEMNLHIHARHADRGQVRREVIAYRSGELSALMTESLEAAIQFERAVHIHLEPLDEAAVRGLVQNLFGSREPVLFARRLHRATGGNPFFALETLKSLVESNALLQNEHGEWTTLFDDTTQGYAELPMPESVIAAVRERVLRLGVEAMRLLETASLAGDAFALEDLQTATTLTEFEALEAFERALELRLIEQQGERYRFAHDLVREALSLGLRPERRRLLHRKLAESLERHAGPAARVADHLERADQPLAAIVWRVRAATDARRVYAHREALHELDQALENGANGLDAFRIHQDRESLSRVLGHSDQRASVIETMMQLARELASPTLELEVQLTRLTFLNHLSHSAEAFQSAQVLLEHPLLTTAQLGQVLVGGGDALVRLDQIAQAEDWFTRALKLNDALSASLQANAHSGLRICAIFRGDYLLARKHITASLEGHRLTGDRTGQAEAITGIGRIEAMLGEYSAAQNTLEMGLKMAQEIGDTTEELAALFSITWTHSLCGHHRQCLESYKITFALNARIRNIGFAIALETYRAVALLQAGELGASLEVIAATVTTAEAQKTIGRLIVAQQRQALALLALGDSHAASAQLERSLEDIPGESMRAYQPALEIGLARCALERNDMALTAMHLERAKPLQHLAYQHDQRDLELTDATLQFRLGKTQPALEATAQPDEVLTLRARSLALRLEVLQSMGVPLLEEIAQAQSWLETTEVPVLEGLELRRVLARTLEGLGQVGVALEMRNVYRQTVQKLASTLETHPELQRYFLEKFLEPT